MQRELGLNLEILHRALHRQLLSYSTLHVSESINGVKDP